MRQATDSLQQPRVLYVVYWGAAEPLGQALVVPAVQRLASLGVKLTLVTFDKPSDLQPDRIAPIRETLDAAGVRWVSLRYHKRPQAAAKLFDLAQGWGHSLAAGLGRTDVVHARTFFGGIIGLVVAPLLGAKLVFHAEGFYSDEMVDGGAWSPRSSRYRVARWLEGQLLDRADAVIALSHRARQAILERQAARHRAVPVAVVPSTVDLDKFKPSTDAMPSRQCLTLLYSGSIGYRYLFDRAARFAAVAAGELGGVRLRVLTRTDRRVVEQILSTSGLPAEAWSVDTLPYAAMPAALAQCHAGLFFLTQGRSNSGFSPTKVGEYWACGLPVVTTPDASDVDAIVRTDRVGVVVEGHTDDHYVAAARALRELVADPDLSLRCRRAAEAHYSLTKACETQLELYRAILLSESKAT